MKSRFLRALTYLALGFFLLSMAWLWLVLNWNYSEGERAGYMQKLSKRGWLCKTWEGEIAMVTMPGAIPEKFDFTVRDDVLADKINQLAGKRLVLSYRQHKFIPSSCFGETEYYVSDIREVADAVPVTPVAPAAVHGVLQPAR